MAQLQSVLKRFLHRRLTAEDARRAIAYRFRQRERSFLRLIRIAVFSNPRSPYLPLFDHCGIAAADVSRWIYADGLEATLSRLYDAGIYVTAEEFKGRRPIQRPGIVVTASHSDFDNPLVSPIYAVQTSGSSGSAMPIPSDLRLLEHEAAYLHHFLAGYDLRQRPVAAWRGVPPVSSGVKLLLRYAKLGLRIERWFAQNRLQECGDTQFMGFTRELVQVSRSLGWWLPEPEYVHQDDAVIIARWLADKRAAGTPPQLDTNASSGVRLCLAALESGLDISGTFFRLGGEPYTPAKADVIQRAGCRAVCHYSMAETGHLGMACTAPAQIDEVHLLTDRTAVLQRDLVEGADGPTRGGLVFTTLMPSFPKFMLNVESGDYGVLHRRKCGCPFDQLGFDLHLSDLRSYGKLTSEGLNYLRGDLVPLVEQVLPARFGGHATDYQLVEVERSGMPYVEVLASPLIGPIDEPALLQAVYEWLRQQRGEELMADFWQDAHTVHVVRRQPYATSSAKILPLHRLRAESAPGSSSTMKPETAQ